MNKVEKQNLANKLLAIYNSSDWLFLINYVGLKADSTLTLRSELRQCGARMSIVKNKVNKIALRQTKFADLDNYLTKQIAIVCGNNPVSIAKIIKKYVSDDKKISVMVSSDGKNLYDIPAIYKIAELPSVDFLRGHLLGTLTSPASTLLRMMKESQASLVRALNAKS
jgi:large subunit ribosomal protein L10